MRGRHCAPKYLDNLKIQAKVVEIWTKFVEIWAKNLVPPPNQNGLICSCLQPQAPTAMNLQ